MALSLSYPAPLAQQQGKRSNYVTTKRSHKVGPRPGYFSDVVTPFGGDVCVLASENSA